jgi:hypothetical protein
MYLSQEEVYEKIRNYFSVEEFFRPGIVTWAKNRYSNWEDKLWSYLDYRLLYTMLVIRESLDRKITINNWKWNGRFKQRGYRDNKSQIVESKVTPYLSAHTRGTAVDFDVDDMSAHDVRQWLIEHEELLPFKIRLEYKNGRNEINWVHLDVNYEPNHSKIYMFNT